jgi:nucleoid-associated protein YgaU
MDTKKVLKYLKLNESSISMILGALVIIVLGVIVINYFRNVRKGEIGTGINTEETPQEVVQPTITPGQGPVEYKVSKGESLWSISEKQYKSGYNWTDIAKANNLKSPYILKVDQTLTIPDIEQKIATVKNSENTSSSTESISSSNYKVVKGDTLWSISLRAYKDGYMWTKIARENHLKNPNLIHPGNSLNLPR